MSAVAAGTIWTPEIWTQPERIGSRRRVIWSPQPKQAVFQSRPEYEVLYGGAAGGGKSDSLLVEALRQVRIPHYRAIIFRKTYPELADLIDRSHELYKRAFPRARYNSSSHAWRFPSGAKIYFGAMQYTKDRLKYRGRQFDLVEFDELTNFTYDEYSYMFSRNRPGGPGTRVYMRSGTNPGGIGHGWVKNRFITPAPPLTKLWEIFDVDAPDGTKKYYRRSRAFVPATVFDNRILLKNSPGYIANLAGLPQKERDALLYGSWDSFEGQVFTEWRNDPDRYEDQRFTHVINPFKIPKHWRVWRGFDFGYARPFAVGWFTADPDGRIYMIAELYGWNGTPDVGAKMHPGEIAAEIRRIEHTNENLKGRKIIGIGDPSIFDESRGESVAGMMIRPPNFIDFSPGDNTRIAGKMQLHYRLAFDKTGIPMFYCFFTCENFIRTIPNLVYDQKHVEDVDTAQEDHCYDMCRYVLMESPISPRPNEAEKPPDFDPLNLYISKKPKNYTFYRF